MRFPVTIALLLPALSMAAETATTPTIPVNPGCRYTPSVFNIGMPAAGGEGTLSITANAGCAWTVTSSAPWLTITSAASGSGNGTVSYAVAANTATAVRSARLSIGGMIQVPVIQEGAEAGSGGPPPNLGCQYLPGTMTLQVPAAGAAGTLPITTGSTCAWTAVSNADWLTLTSASGTGSGSVA